ncbi:VOC family protein [Streptomyces sp. NPDC001691]|uniref:VOC family protein n=1 Tax=unclassified Streptomyces TaxID=2593676 RepID=UPI001CB90FDD|nr:VOC family protein [Streptomyces sp. SDr-06]
MNITASAVTLHVDDAAASARFFTGHLGFRQVMSLDEEYICLSRDDDAADIVLSQGPAEAPPEPASGRGPQNVTVTFTVTSIADEDARLRRENAPITTSLRQKPWGEWALQLTDPNGVVVELVEWVPPAGA